MILRTMVRPFRCAEVLNELHVDILDYIESISVQAGCADLEQGNTVKNLHKSIKRWKKTAYLFNISLAF